MHINCLAVFLAMTPAPSGAQGATQPSNPLLSFLPMVLLVVVFYFLLIRPSQNQAKQLKTRLALIKRGDKVVTAGGIVGLVKKAAADATEVDVEIAPNVTVSVVRSTITSVLTPEPANDKG